MDGAEIASCHCHGNMATQLRPVHATASTRPLFCQLRKQWPASSSPLVSRCLVSTAVTPPKGGTAQVISWSTPHGTLMACGGWGRKSMTLGFNLAWCVADRLTQSLHVTLPYDLLDTRHRCQQYRVPYAPQFAWYPAHVQNIRHAKPFPH